MQSEAFRKDKSSGFAGAVAGMTLADLVQLKGLNGFSGCLSVEYEEESGVVFFRDGEVIHAEQGNEKGETAFYRIITWPSGKFIAQPKVTTTNNTIKQSISYLLLEGHRLLDERTHSSDMSDLMRHQETSVNEEERREDERRMSEINARLKPVAGVDYAVLISKEGAPISDESYDAEALAAQGIFLGIFGNQLGTCLGMDNELAYAAVQGKENHLMLFDSPRQYLCISLKGVRQLGAVESEVRKALAPKK